MFRSASHWGLAANIHACHCNLIRLEKENLHETHPPGEWITETITLGGSREWPRVLRIHDVIQVDKAARGQEVRCRFVARGRYDEIQTGCVTFGQRVSKGPRAYDLLQLEELVMRNVACFCCGALRWARLG